MTDAVMPKELRLGVPPKMPQARTYLFRQQSVKSSYAPTETIQINIPRLQRSYLRKDSYLRFRVSGTYKNPVSNGSLNLDTCGAFGFFERMEVFDYLGSTVLESIAGVPQLTALLLDLGLKEIQDTISSNYNLGSGTNYVHTSEKNNPLVASGAVPSTVYIQQSSDVLPCTAGDQVEPYGSLSANADVPFTREYAIPLPSFLGFLSDRMVPLHNGFTIVLTLATKNTPFLISVKQECNISLTGATPTLGGTKISYVDPTTTAAGGSLTWSLTNVLLDCQILELGPMADTMLMSSTQGGPLVVWTKSFRNYVSNIIGARYSGGALTTTGQQEFTMNLNLNVASLTDILWIMRSTSYLDNFSFLSVGARTRNFLQKWQFQYGSTVLPQSNGIESMASYLPVTGATLDNTYFMYGNGSGEAYRELLKSRPIDVATSRMTVDEYNWDWKWDGVLDAKTTPTIVTFNKFNGVGPSPRSPFGCGRFAAGLNLQLVPNKEGQIISGLNTNGMNTSIRGFFHPLYTDYMDDVRVDAWAEYDAFINISPGIATTVSF